MSINKAVFYLFLASALTVGTMLWISKRMHQKPNRVQTAMEVAYDMTKNTITGGNMEPKMASRWFPFLAALFFWIWFSNMLGYLPLPTNTEHTFDLFGVEVPSFAIYAATANLSVTLALALITFAATHVEGIRYNGVRRYLKSWIPEGVPGPLLALIVPLEVISQFMRLISLSVRLFANMLAGHMLILVMLGLIFIFSSWFLIPISVVAGTVIYLFEVGIVVTIQAFVFALLSAIYIGAAIEPEH